MPAQPVQAREVPAPRVLIVDDAAGMRAYLSIILGSAGFDCVEARDGAEAFETVLGGGIDLVITDLDMPEMDGFGLISAIGLLPASRSRLPIIVVSGLLDDTLADQRRELRAAAALLAKPVQPEQLLRAVARVMDLRFAAG